jgi:hypothetical protein
MQVLKSESEKLSGGQKACQRHLSVSFLCRYFVTSCYWSLNVLAFIHPKLNRSVDWYVEYHSDCRSLLHDVASGFLTQRHTDVPLERKEKENTSTDKNLIARRSTRVPWPDGRHVSHGPSPRIPEPSRRKHHEKSHGTFAPFFRPPRGPTPRRTKSRAISNHSRSRDSGARSDG